MKLSQIINNYWNNKYKLENVNNLPSQFSSFVLNEIKNKYPIIDCGCGDGRDSGFFLKYNKIVYGLDSSKFAIEICKKKIGLRKNNSKFLLIDFEDTQKVNKIISSLKKISNNYNIYSRFFLHAISRKAEKNFLEFSSELCGIDGNIFLEFRTKKDSMKKKFYPGHFRRYINLSLFKKTIIKKNFEIKYIYQGKGMAKYYSEDPHVARMILKTKY